MFFFLLLLKSAPSLVPPRVIPRTPIALARVRSPEQSTSNRWEATFALWLPHPEKQAVLDDARHEGADPRHQGCQRESFNDAVSQMLQ